MAEFVRVAEVPECADPSSQLVEVDGEMVALFCVGGQFYALDDVCTHDGGPLAGGELTDHKVACPRHGAKFDIRTGAALSMPAVRATQRHDVKVEDGGVWVRLRSGKRGDGPAAHGLGSIAPPPPAAAPLPQVAAAPAAGTASEAPAPAVAATVSAILCEDSVREILKEVKDPELFVNIVDLGLIYGVTLSPAADAPADQTRARAVRRARGRVPRNRDRSGRPRSVHRNAPGVRSTLPSISL